MKLSLLIAGLVAASALQAAPVYNNTTTDTGDTVFYSTGPYTEIGDRIQLGGTERNATSAAVQFFNNGASNGSFDATLNFYSFVGGSPGVGGLLNSYSVLNQAISSGSTLNVNWLLAGLVLPNNLIFTVKIDRQAAGLDLGLTVFDPPTVGSSSNQFFIVKGGSGFAQASLGNGGDNIYFRLDASSGTSVPEPGTAGLVFLAMLPLLTFRGRRAVSR